MSEETKYGEIQGIIDDMVGKMQTLEKSNAELQKALSKLEKEKKTFDEQMADQIEQTQLWRETSDLRSKEIDEIRARKPKGFDMMVEFFGTIYEKELDKILAPFIDGNRKVYEAIIALPKEDQEALEKFRKTQDKNLLAKIKQFQET